MKRAIVLSAGLGTRLRPLTEWVPKPLVWLGDRPQLDHVLVHLKAAGFEQAIVNTHHLHEQFDDAWVGRQPLPVVRVHEPRILGTAGGVSNAANALGQGDVLVYNGDILADVDLVGLRRTHADRAHGATLVAAPVGSAGTGTLGLASDGSVARLRGEVFGEEVLGADYIGVAALGAELRGRLPTEGCLVGDGLMPWLRGGRKVATFVHHGGFRDTGSLEGYLAANLDWLGGRSSYVDPTATVADGVILEGAIVGPGARVTGVGTLRSVVVWPFANARTPLEREIVTLRGVVSVP